MKTIFGRVLCVTLMGLFGAVALVFLFEQWEDDEALRTVDEFCKMAALEEDVSKIHALYLQRKEGALWEWKQNGDRVEVTIYPERRKFFYVCAVSLNRQGKPVSYDVGLDKSFSP